MAEIQQTLVNCNQGINCKDSHFTDIQFLEEGGTEYQRFRLIDGTKTNKQAAVSWVPQQIINA